MLDFVLTIEFIIYPSTFSTYLFISKEQSTAKYCKYENKGVFESRLEPGLDSSLFFYLPLLFKLSIDEKRGIAMKFNWKKMLTLGAALISVTAFAAGCGGGQSSDSAASSSSGKELAAITHANWKPFEFIDKGQVVGFDIDLMNAVAEEAGYKANISDVGWESIFQQIKSKSADVAISGITATDERRQSYEFSLPYFVSKTALLVPEDSDITSVADIKDKDKVVSVQNGSTAQIALEKVLGVNSPNIKKTTLSDQMLLNGQVDAMAGDDTSINEIIQQHPDKKLKVVYDDAVFTPEYFSMMYPKDGDAKVKADLDAALKKVIDSGKYAEIYKKWFKHDPNMDDLKKALEK